MAITLPEPIRELTDRRQSHKRDGLFDVDTRAYQCGQTTFFLTRHSQMVPPAYNLYWVEPNCLFESVIQINKSNWWGGGLSWKDAEAKAFEAINDTIIKGATKIVHLLAENFEDKNQWLLNVVLCNGKITGSATAQDAVTHPIVWDWKRKSEWFYNDNGSYPPRKVRLALARRVREYKAKYENGFVGPDTPTLYLGVEDPG